MLNSVMAWLGQYVSFRRLAVAAVLVPAILVSLILFVQDDSADATVSEPTLLETPPSDVATSVGVREGHLAPDFEISTTDGRRVKLSDFRGRPVVVNFHALWCTSCLSEMPEIKAAQEERGIDTFAVLAVNSGETKSRALEFVDFLEAPFTFGLDINLAVSDAYGVRGLPATIFIDSEGVIQTIYYGYTGTELLNRFLDSAINAEPPGEIPPVIRLISSIPRQRVLNVERDGEDLIFTSRSLRCDATYCAEEILGDVIGYLGLEIVETDLTASVPELRIRHDPELITEEQVIDAVAHSLTLIDDPVYEGEIEVVLPEG